MAESHDFLDMKPLIFGKSHQIGQVHRALDLELIPSTTVTEDVVEHHGRRKRATSRTKSKPRWRRRRVHPGGLGLYTPVSCLDRSW